MQIKFHGDLTILDFTPKMVQKWPKNDRKMPPKMEKIISVHYTQQTLPKNTNGEILRDDRTGRVYLDTVVQPLRTKACKDRIRTLVQWNYFGTWGRRHRCLSVCSKHQFVVRPCQCSRCIRESKKRQLHPQSAYFGWAYNIHP